MAKETAEQTDARFEQLTQLFPQPRRIAECGGLCPQDAPCEEVMAPAVAPEQGFRLTLSSRKMRIEASDEGGLFYGRQTLAQLRLKAGEAGLACRVIEDWPDYRHRGYMLDVSRDRVPTMGQLFHLVDQLAVLRYNQLQLYTEHSFAYADHRTVWENASPITAAEMRELDAYCRERCIELVPNQNSFGHMERWLCYPGYHHLAECPGGFAHPLGGWREQGSVLRPEPRSLEFLDGLYGELLPNFTSGRFHIGGDEPWELGQGASRERVEAEGKHAVYLDFLSRVCRLAEAHGAAPMCWADVLLEAPDSIESLPAGVTPVLWGYEADHPFEAQCAVLASLERPFYVAPGDSTWTSHTGRAHTMEANLAAAAATGLKYGASGYLLTHWGDGGHPQPWVVSIAALVRAGLTAWNQDQVAQSLDVAMVAALSESDHPESLAQLLTQAGTLDARLNCPLPNKSFLAHSLHLEEAALSAFDPQPTPAALKEQIEACDALLGDCRGGDPLAEELALALRMNRFAAYRCLGEGHRAPEKPADVVADFRKLWGRRSRRGGLEQSLARMPGLR